MSLHILRHKKWHPWNKENQERFDIDEAKHEKEVEKEEEINRKRTLSSKIEMMKAQMKTDYTTLQNDNNIINDHNIDNQIFKPSIGTQSKIQKPFSLYSIIENETKDRNKNSNLDSTKENKSKDDYSSPNDIISQSNTFIKERTDLSSNSLLAQSNIDLSKTQEIIKKKEQSNQNIQPNISYSNNPEYMKEKENQYKKEMKQSGIANWRLNSFQREDQPWYMDSSKDKETIKRNQYGSIVSKDQYKKNENCNELSVQFEDPMNDYISQSNIPLEDNQITKKVSLSKDEKSQFSYQAMHQISDITIPEYRPKQSQNNNELSLSTHKHKHKHIHKHSKSINESINNIHINQDKQYEKELLIETLRKERMKREENERKKTIQTLLSNSDLSTHKDYNSQNHERYNRRHS